MAAALFFSFTIVYGMAFFFKRKHLHPLELLFVWMFSYFLHASLILILHLTYGSIHITFKLPGYFVYEAFRMIIVPLTVTWLLNEVAKPASILAKIAYTAGCVIYLSVFNELLEMMKIVRFSQSWNVALTASIYLGTVIPVIAAYFLFHKLLQREVSFR